MESKKQSVAEQVVDMMAESSLCTCAMKNPERLRQVRKLS